MTFKLGSVILVNWESRRGNWKAADMNVGNNFEVQILHNLQVVKGDCLKYVFMMS